MKGAKIFYNPPKNTKMFHAGQLNNACNVIRGKLINSLRMPTSCPAVLLNEEKLRIGMPSIPGKAASNHL